jgi:acetyltransferase-like isoleucine patch superfamily enzyme
MASRTATQAGEALRQRGWGHYLAVGLRSPGVVLQVLRARWQLRRCDVLPPTVRVRGHVRVEKYGGRIEVGERVRFEGRTIPVEIVAHRGAVVRIGNGTYVNYATSISAHHEVTIGDNCLIGNYVVIMDSDYHDVHDRTRGGYAASVVIEDDVWIGIRATILKGVRIGRGSVIGAGAVVTEDIPPGSVAFGVPARVVRRL